VTRFTVVQRRKGSLFFRSGMRRDWVTAEVAGAHLKRVPRAAPPVDCRASSHIQGRTPGVAACMVIADQKDSNRNPQSATLTSSTDHSEGFSQNSLPSLTAYAIIAVGPADEVKLNWSFLVKGITRSRRGCASRLESDVVIQREFLRDGGCSTTTCQQTKRLRLPAKKIPAQTTLSPSYRRCCRATRRPS
jgi:hypothetical protein